MTTNRTNDLSIAVTENVSRVVNDFIFASVNDLLRKVPSSLIRKCEINGKTGALQMKVASSSDAEDDFKEITRIGSVHSFKSEGEDVSLRMYGINVKGFFPYAFGKALLEKNGEKDAAEKLEEGARVHFEFSYFTDVEELYNFLQSIDFADKVTDDLDGKNFLLRLRSARTPDEVMSMLDLVQYETNIGDICTSIAEVIFERTFKAKMISFDESKPFKLDADGVPENTPVDPSAEEEKADADTTVDVEFECDDELPLYNGSLEREGKL